MYPIYIYGWLINPKSYILYQIKNYVGNKKSYIHFLWSRILQYETSSSKYFSDIYTTIKKLTTDKETNTKLELEERHK